MLVEFSNLIGAIKSGNLELLLELHLNMINLVKNNSSKTFLHKACEKGSVKIVKYLLENGADINVIDEYSKSPLDYALKEGNQEIIKLLITHGAMTNFQDPKIVENLNIEIIEFLINNGIDINTILNKNIYYNFFLILVNQDITEKEKIKLIFNYYEKNNLTIEFKYEMLKSNHKSVKKILTLLNYDDTLILYGELKKNSFTDLLILFMKNHKKIENKDLINDLIKSMTSNEIKSIFNNENFIDYFNENFNKLGSTNSDNNYYIFEKLIEILRHHHSNKESLITKSIYEYPIFQHKYLCLLLNLNENEEDFITFESIEDIPNDEFILLENKIAWNMNSLIDYILIVRKGINYYDENIFPENTEKPIYTINDLELIRNCSLRNSKKDIEQQLELPNIYSNLNDEIIKKIKSFGEKITSKKTNESSDDDIETRRQLTIIELLEFYENLTENEKSGLNSLSKQLWNFDSQIKLIKEGKECSSSFGRELIMLHDKYISNKHIITF